ncbi:MAG: hypothetical protein FWD49_07590 [Firmicutes bacterium]|nr:hypothetical protein [Bacillota bacterium]
MKLKKILIIILAVILLGGIVGGSLALAGVFKKNTETKMLSAHFNTSNFKSSFAEFGSEGEALILTINDNTLPDLRNIFDAVRKEVTSKDYNDDLSATVFFNQNTVVIVIGKFEGLDSGISLDIMQDPNTKAENYLIGLENDSVMLSVLTLKMPVDKDGNYDFEVENCGGEGGCDRCMEAECGDSKCTGDDCEDCEEATCDAYVFTAQPKGSYSMLFFVRSNCPGECPKDCSSTCDYHCDDIKKCDCFKPNLKNLDVHIYYFK